MVSPDFTAIYSERAASYASGRPDYPRAVLDTLRAHVPAPADVADLGAGTGIMSALLLEFGYRVRAVEPNKAMRAIAEAALGDHRGFTSVAATAEETGLPERSIAAITVAQALHWFDLPRARDEMMRILRPGGWIVFAWNDLDKDTPLGRDIDQLLARLVPAYAEIAARTDLAPHALALQAVPVGVALVQQYFSHRHELDATRFRSRFVSASYAPHADALAMMRLERELDAVFRAHARDGVVALAYVTTAIYARP